MTTLDILIPHFNDPDGFAMSVKSIIDQDWQGSRRLVVCDDGSRPEMLAALEAQIAEIPFPVTLLKNPENRGRPFTRNVLLDAVESPYTAWLDAGDEWYAKKLSTQFKRIYKAELDGIDHPYWVTCNYDWKWSRRKARKCQQKTDQDQVKALLVGSTLRAYLWTLLAPSQHFKSVGRFDEKLPRLQDLDFFINFVSQNGEILSSGADEPLCVYHKSDTGRDGREIRRCNDHIMNKYRYFYTGYGKTFVNNRLFDMEMHSARFAHNNGDVFGKLKFMAKAWLHRPMRFARHVFSKGLTP